MADTSSTAPTWQPTACILCECNCGIVVQLEGRTAGQDPRRQGAPGLAGLHLQQGPAAGPLPEQPQPADLADAPHAPTADYEEIDWDTAITEIAERLRPHPRRATAATRSSTTAAAARATTSAAPTAAPSSRHSASQLPLQCARRRRRPASPGWTATSTAATPAASSSTPRCRCSSARTRGCRRASRGPARCSTRSPRTRQRSMIVIDPVITDTAKLADFHLRVRPGTDAWCLSALAAVAGAGRPVRQRVPRRACHAAPNRSGARCATVDIERLRAAAAASTRS